MRVHHASNPTAKKAIPKDGVAIEIIRDANGRPSAFTVAELGLVDLKLPPTALISCVAYSDINEVRHELGTVAASKIPSTFKLEDFESGTPLNFRIFVRDPSDPKILASCEGLRPKLDVESNDSERQPLLYVEYEDLGEQLWQMRLVGGNRPTLVLNDTHSYGVRSKMEARDPVLRALVIPQAIQQALVYYALNDPPDEDLAHWQNQWRYALDEIGAEELPEIDDLSEFDQILNWAAVTASKYAHHIKLGTILTTSLPATGEES
jgi:hypothetical protein